MSAASGQKAQEFYNFKRCESSFKPGTLKTEKAALLISYATPSGTFEIRNNQCRFSIRYGELRHGPRQPKVSAGWSLCNRVIDFIFPSVLHFFLQ